MGNDWIDVFPPDRFVCSRCNAEKKIGGELPIMAMSFERTKAFNAAVDDFVGKHAACKEVELKNVLAVLVVCLAMVACGGDGPTAPEVVVSAPVVEGSTLGAPTVVAPPPVAPSDKPHVGTISGASFSIVNGSGSAAQYVARLYEVKAGGEQQLRQEFVSPSVPSGESWGGAFAQLPCNYQIDLDHYFVVVNPPAPGEIKSKIVTGNVCPTPTPTPTPEPTPPPQPECEPVRFWNQSETHNQNNIKFNVHATGKGTWKLELYAASSLSEFTNNDPDYIKDVDVDVVTKCQNGQVELKVDYDWRYHGSSHWWARLSLNGVPVWKSAVVVKS